MPIPLSSIGEVVVAAMVNSMRMSFIELCGLADKCDPEFVASCETLAYSEVGLWPFLNMKFDGASRVDLVVRLNPHLAVPFELKLGTKKLTKARIDAEWLDGCSPSHQGKRWSGNMMSILERNFGCVSADILKAKINDRAVELTRQWFIIGKSSVLASWTAAARPSFSPNVRFCAFETIVERFGGREPFNELVGGLLTFDYYREWVGAVEDGQ